MHELDASYIVTARHWNPLPEKVTGSGGVALPKPRISGDGEADDVAEPGSEPGAGGQAPVVIGDVWQAIREKVGVPGGFKRLGSGPARIYLQAPDNRILALPAPGLVDWRSASAELLGLLTTWHLQPVASGKFPPPEDPSQRMDIRWEMVPPQLLLTDPLRLIRGRAP